jgi:hypothetical protein
VPFRRAGSNPVRGIEGAEEICPLCVSRSTNPPSGTRGGFAFSYFLFA